MIAALYVERDGPYWNLPDVDPWDLERDARLYAGPWPVVAHPPCQKWCQLAPLNASRIKGYYIGDDKSRSAQRTTSARLTSRRPRSCGSSRFCVWRCQMSADRTGTDTATDTATRVTEIQGRSESTTAGEWFYDGRDILTRRERDDAPMRHLVIPLPETWHESQGVNKADAAFVAHAHQDVPWLLSRLAVVEASLDTHREALIEVEEVLATGYDEWGFPEIYPTLERVRAVLVGETG